MMKKTLPIILLAFLSLLIAMPVTASEYGYTFAHSLTGGATGALDAIDGQNLGDGDIAFVRTASISYEYILDADSALTEDSPSIIQPDSNGGDKRWILLSTGDKTTHNLIRNPMAVGSRGVQVDHPDASDLVTNGAFGAGITSWTDNSTGDGSFAWDTDHAELDANTGTAEMGQTITVVKGKIYELSFTIAENCTSLAVTGGTSAYAGTEHFSKTYTATGAKTITLRAAGTSLYLEFKSSTNEVVSLDDITLYEQSLSFTGADTYAYDGWIKTSTLEDVYRIWASDQFTTHSEFYATKSEATVLGDGVVWVNGDTDALSLIEKFAGRVVTLSAKVISSTASDLALRIDDGTGISYSNTHSGGGTEETLSITKTISNSSTDISFGWTHISIHAGDAYITDIMVSFGSSIPRYVPPPPHVVAAEVSIALTDYTADDDVAADVSVDLEVQSASKIPVNCSAVHAWVEGQNSAADKYLDVLSASGGVRSTRITSQVANIEVGQAVRVVTSDAKLYIDVEDANWDDVTVEINSVELE